MKCCLTVFVSALFFASISPAQSTPVRPAFEVADIKPSDPSAPPRQKERMLPGGRIELPGQTVKAMIGGAYGVQENMIAGLPKWAESDRFDIVAKAAGQPSVPLLLQMMQSLLADRFQLVIHREDKAMPAYVLSLGKRALKLEDGDGGRQQCGWSMLEGGLRRRDCKNLGMAEFARQLPGWGGIGIDLPVIDQTGLKGAYNFHLDVGFPGERREDAAPVETGPTIFAALEQVGLKLESKRMPVSTIVVDRVERPGAN